MRFSTWTLALALAACSRESTNTGPDGVIAGGNLRYEVTTLAGIPLLTGRLVVKVLDDSTIVGSWSTEWAPGADRSVEVGGQVGRGALAGRQGMEKTYLDLNPGFADNNVILAAAPTDRGFEGTWEWVTVTGTRASGRFSAHRY